MKGNGFIVTQLKPYYYHPRDRVALLVLADQPGSVQTATRWTPALYEWGAVFAIALATLLLLLALRPRMLRKARQAHGPDTESEDT